MTASDSIKRISADPDGLDFASLRKEAIGLSQSLSGKIWTDYNLHDPGVTILEQLCFGMTELAYQAGISTANYLADQHGVIDFNQYALFKPHEIFPNRAVTPQDYCKLLIDAVPEIDEIHLQHANEAGQPKGLYNIWIKLLEPLTGQPFNIEQRQKIVQEVRRLFLQNRNLGEDINQVDIETSVPCFLKGVIETSGRRPHAEIYADIFFQCARKISSNARIERYEDAFAQSGDLAQLFTGPLTQHGYINEQELGGEDEVRPLQELSGLIASIDGVKKVYELELVDSDGKSLSEKAITQHSFFLQFPADEVHQDFLKVNFNPGKTTDSSGLAKTTNKKMKKLLDDTKRQLQKLEFEYKAFRNNKGNAATFYQLPQGKVREELDYYSIQNQFPNIYGINSAGIPSSETNERKNQAKQLKAYLFPFEQLLANFLQHIQHLQRLFALNEVRNQSYFSQYLDNHNIPHIEELYTKATPANVRAVQAKHDNFTDRKSRALDTLLAIYGEEFSHEALLHFNYYHQDSPDYWVIDNKINYLQNLREISSQRGGAFNTGEAHWNTTNISSLQKKIGILLGLPHFSSSRSLCNVLQDNKINIIGDDIIAKNASSLTAEQTDHQYLPELSDTQEKAQKKWRYKPGKPLTLSETMLREGVHLDNYRLVTKNDEASIYFNQPNQKKLVFLKKFDNKDAAIDYGHKFRKIIVSLNTATEGFHLLEHILLRPRSKKTKTSSDNTEDFLSFRLSIIFPSWTARFSNPSFREFAQKTLCNNLPAHLFPDIYWLDFAELEEFEKHYQSWLNCLHNYEHSLLATEGNNTGVKQLDAAADTLVSWLQQHFQPDSYWV
jgi:hypothetical protein